MLHDTEENYHDCFSGKRGVPAAGLFGGYPASTTWWYAKFNPEIRKFIKTNHRMPHNYNEIGGEEKLLPVKVSHLILRKGDIFHYNNSGGGSFGDPLDRDPSRVLTDVRNGYVSLEQALNAYGVVIDVENMQMNMQATEKKREKMRRERFEKARIYKSIEVKGKVERIAKFNMYLDIADKGGKRFIQCNRCSTLLCSIQDHWKEFCAIGEHKLGTDYTNNMKIHIQERKPEKGLKPALILREYFCPKCQRLYETEVDLEGSAIYNDYQPNVLKMQHI